MVVGTPNSLTISASTILDSTSLSAMTPSKSKMIALAIRSAHPTIILGSGMSVSNQVRLPNVTEPPATAECYAGGEIVRTLAAGRPPGGQITLTASQPRFTPAWACPATSGAHHRCAQIDICQAESCGSAVSRPAAKNISLVIFGKSAFDCGHPASMRGAYASSRT